MAYISTVQATAHPAASFTYPNALEHAANCNSMEETETTLAPRDPGIISFLHNTVAKLWAERNLIP
jgi:hypothetical protein